MESKLIIILALGILSLDITSQSSFVKHYGEFSGKGYSLIINDNDNYIIAGSKSFSGDPKQFFCRELNSIGDTQWLEHYGTDSIEEANQIIQTIEGGFSIIGYTSDFLPGYRSIYFVKTTSLGSTSWIKQIDLGGAEFGSSVVQTPSGDYFIGGSCYKNGISLFDFCLIKADTNGDTLWTKKYGGSYNDESSSMQITSDGGLIMSGYSETSSHGPTDMYVIKTDSLGNTLWAKQYGGDLDEKANSIRQTSDGGYIMTGYSKSYGLASENMYVVKTNPGGDTLWTKTYGKIGRYSWGNDIIQTNDSGYIITGLIKTVSSNGSYDLYVVKIDPLGNVQWEKDVKIEPSITSYTSSQGNSIKQTSDGGYAIAGTWFSSVTFELLFLKMTANGTVGFYEIPSRTPCTLFPNPFSISAKIECGNDFNGSYILTVLNREGQLVQTKVVLSDHIEIERRGLISGLYFFQLRTDREVISNGKFIIE